MKDIALGLQKICFPDLNEIKMHALSEDGSQKQQFAEDPTYVIFQFLINNLFFGNPDNRLSLRIREDLRADHWAVKICKFDETNKAYTLLLQIAAFVKLVNLAYKKNCYELLMSEHQKDSGYLAKQIQQEITRREKQKNPETEQALKGTKFFMSDTGTEQNIECANSLTINQI